MKTKKKRKKRPAVVTGGMRMVDQDEWGGAGRGDSDDEGTCMCVYATLHERRGETISTGAST
jgi:hypothetical protein